MQCLGQRVAEGAVREVPDAILNRLSGRCVMDLMEYPKERTLKDGSKVTLRPMVREDEEGLKEYFGALSEMERLYLRNDVMNPEIIRFWVENLDYDNVLPILAIDEAGRIVGNGTLHFNKHSWSRHVGNIRLSVSSEFRRRGLAWILAGEAFHNALMTDLQKIVAEVLPEQEDVRLAFNQLGFRTEAVLKEQHIDARGRKHDVIIISNDINDLWKRWTEHCEALSGIQQKEY